MMLQKRFLRLILPIAFLVASHPPLIAQLHGVISDWGLAGSVKTIHIVDWSAESHGDSIRYHFFGRWVEFHFDAQGRELFQIEHGNDSAVTLIRTNEYDPDGRLIGITMQRDAHRPPFSKHVFSYSENGSVIEESVIDLPEKLNARYVYRLDEISRLVELDGYRSDGRHFVHQEITYGPWGKERVMDLLLLENSVCNVTYIYDGKGHLKSKRDEVSSLGVKEYTSSKLFMYDSHGRLSSEKDKHNGDPLNKSKYEYDPAGNWVRKLTFEGRSLKSVTERRITYW